MSVPKSPGPAISPFCMRLRSKKFYFLDRPALTPGDILDASGHCWCARTQQSVGPDGEVVAPEDCLAERQCFEAHPPLT